MDLHLSPSLLWVIIKPSNLLLYIALLGVILKKKKIGQLLLFIAALIFIAFSLLPIGSALTSALESRFPLPILLEEPSGIIVLAGSENAPLSAARKQPQLKESADRLTTFISLAYQFPSARIAHVGNSRDYQGVSQSDVAQEVILQAGIDPVRVVFVTESRNTCQDARYANDKLKPQEGEQWLLITSALHMPRAIACFRAVGWNIIAYPTDYRYHGPIKVLSLTQNLTNIDAATHEWLGLIYYRLTQKTKELFPSP